MHLNCKWTSHNVHLAQNWKVDNTNLRVKTNRPLLTERKIFQNTVRISRIKDLFISVPSKNLACICALQRGGLYFVASTGKGMRLRNHATARKPKAGWTPTAHKAGLLCKELFGCYCFTVISDQVAHTLRELLEVKASSTQTWHTVHFRTMCHSCCFILKCTFQVLSFQTKLLYLWSTSQPLNTIQEVQLFTYLKFLFALPSSEWHYLGGKCWAVIS